MAFGGTDKYYNPDNKLVNDGDVAYADDLNAINYAVDSAFEQIATDLDVVGNMVAGEVEQAHKWAEESQGVLPDPLAPGEYSAQAHAIESKEWASNALGNVIHLADGTTSATDSAKTSASKAATSATAAASSATAAASSATAAASSATSAASSATSATNSKNAAATSESNAATSAFNADASADLAAVYAAQLPNAATIGANNFPVVNATGDGWDSYTYDEVASLLNLAELDANEDVTGFWRVISGGTAANMAAMYNSASEAGFTIHRASNLPVLKFSKNGFYTYLGIDSDNTLKVGGGSTNGAYKIWHEGNDGPASGLDADTIDGIHASEIASLVANTFTGTQSITGVTPTLKFNETDQSVGLDYSQIVQSGANLSIQCPVSRSIYFSGYDFGNMGEAYIRQSDAYHKIWHQNNDGAGSGLDADTVDGLQPDIAGTSSTIVARDSGGGITGTSIYSSLADTSVAMTGALAFRTSAADKTIKFCNNASSVRDWLAAAPLASPTFTGTPAAPTAAADTSTTQLATTAFVTNQAGTTNPLMNGTVAVGTSKKYARADHVHASDTSRLPITGGDITGDLRVYRPASPTTGVIFFGNTGTKYLYFDGTLYNLPGAELLINNEYAAKRNKPAFDYYDSIGAICTCCHINADTVALSPGATIAGSKINPSSTNATATQYSGVALPGTWRILGCYTSGPDRRTAAFQRIA